MYEQILYEVKEPVATITLNRPDRLNALTDRMLAELRHALAAAERDSKVVGIVLTGSGRGFTAGMDMQSLGEIADGGAAGGAGLAELQTDLGNTDMGPEFGVTWGYLMTIKKPLIAAVNGPCAGLGFSIAMLCDLRFASEKAVFTTSFAQRGLVAEHGVSWILPRLIGPAHALDLLLTARRVDAEEAFRLGIANRVIAPEKLLDETRAYIEELAAKSSPTSLMVMKQQVYRHLMQPLGEAMRETNVLMDESLNRADFKEGVASFVERRPPRFPRVGKD